MLETTNFLIIKYFKKCIFANFLSVQTLGVAFPDQPAYLVRKVCSK